MLTISPATTALLAAIEHLSHTPLVRRTEVGILIELSVQQKMERTLDELSFYAKFCHKTYGVMQRIGPRAEGFEKLAHEFHVRVEQCKEVMRQLLEHASEDVRQMFTARFLTLTPTSFGNLLELFADLTQYKNYRLDEERGRSSAGEHDASSG
ncbi:MAG: hypothetical protein C4326_09560 [Ignavibacteria bacterium]